MYTGQLKATYTGSVNLGENTDDADTLAFTVVSGATLLDLQGLTVTGADAGGVAISGANATGGITMYGTTSADKIVGSSGLDIIFAGTGDDLITVAAAADIVAGEVLSGGLGTDTLYLSAAGVYNLNDLSSTADNLVGEAGIENLIVKHTAITLDEAISGSALRINTDGAVTLNMTIAMTGTTLDLSKITFSKLGDVSPATETALAAGNDKFTITGSASADAITLSSLGDVVDGGTGADTIVGGTGADAITGGAGADSMTGGGGADSFVFTTASTGTPTATNFDTITDFSKVAGATFDTISATALVIAVQTAAAGAGVATLSLGGVATFNAADTTLAQHLIAVAAAQDATAGATTIWQEGADAYLFISDGTLAIGATDVLIKLTGVTVGALTVAANAITAIA